MKFTYKLPRFKTIKSRFDYIVSKSTKKVVLHVGCVDQGLLDQKLGTEKLLHHVLDKKAKEITGLDIDFDGIKRMTEFGYKNMVCADIEEWSSSISYEVIVLGEIIEHIDNCGKFINSLKRISTKETSLIFTTPNSYYYLFWIFNLFRRENIHPDHNYLFSLLSLKQLFLKFDLEIDEFVVVWEKVDFIKLSDSLQIRFIKRILNFLFNIPYYLRFLFPQFGKGLIVEAKFKDLM